MQQEELFNQLQSLDQFQSPCHACGLCLEVCTTYQATGWEHESPRGRIQLARNLMEGHIEPHSSSLDTFDHCVGCRACERVCPAKVSYSSLRAIVQNLRKQLAPLQTSFISRQTYKKWIHWHRKISSSFWHRYGWTQVFYGSQSLVPQKSFLRNVKKKNSKNPEEFYLIIGCLQDILNGKTIEKLICYLEEQWNLLVQVDRKQPCCGAIFEGLSQDRKLFWNFPQEQILAKKYQTQCQEHFKKWLPSHSLYLSAQCLCFMQRQGSPSLGKTLTAFLWDHLQITKKRLVLKETALEVYYQPYCGQKEEATWLLLKSIENLTVRWIPDAAACCGGYGGESVLFPEQAMKWVHSKCQFIPKGSIIVVTSQECYVQFKEHVGSEYSIIHVFELLSERTLISTY